MGFKVPRKTARLEFEGDEFEGMEIICALDLTLGAQEHFEGLQADAASATKEEKNAAMRASIDYFAKNCIDSWNLENEDGTPISIAGESFYQFPGWFAVAVMNGWTNAIKKASEVGGPLAEPSKNGSGSEVESEMTEAPSHALQN